MRPVVLQQANWAHSYGKLGSQGQQEKETSSVKCYSQVCLHHIWYHSGSVTTQTEGMDKPTVPLVVCGGDAGGGGATVPLVVCVGAMRGGPGSRVIVWMTTGGGFVAVFANNHST